MWEKPCQDRLQNKKRTRNESAVSLSDPQFRVHGINCVILKRILHRNPFILPSREHFSLLSCQLNGKIPDPKLVCLRKLADQFHRFLQGAHKATSSVFSNLEYLTAETVSLQETKYQDIVPFWPSV